MAILSDSEILKRIEKGDIIIKPFHRECLGSNSYDVHLGKFLKFYTNGIIDAKKRNPTEMIEIPKCGLILRPYNLYLASTIEYTETRGLVPFLDGKSSIGRLGILVHKTAGRGDIGFKGHWTLEMEAGKDVKIYAGMPVGQIFFQEIAGKVLNPYNKKKNAKYSGQGSMPVESRMWKNFGKDPFWK